MFKIYDGKMKVLNKMVELLDGNHFVAIDDIGNVYQDTILEGELKKICRYNYDAETGKIQIEGPPDSFGASSDTLSGGVTANNRMTTSRTILYAPRVEGTLIEGMGPSVSAKVDGIMFAFDYRNLATTVMAAVPYRFVSGRVCFDVMGYISQRNTFYTARPFSGTCGSAGMTQLLTTDPILYSYGLSNNFGRAATADLFEWVNNRQSLAFFWRSSSKYLFFGGSLKGIYSVSTLDGIMQSSGGTLGTAPQGVANESEFSMTNLSN